MKYLGLVKPAIPGTKHAKVEIISAEDGAVIPDGAVLLENSRAKEFIGCLIAFDKIMHKGTGSAYVICSKIHLAEQPKPLEANVQEDKLPAEETQAPDVAPIPDLKKEPDLKPEIVLPQVGAAPEPDVEKLQQQIASLKNNLSKKEATIDKLKKKIETLERKQSELKEMDKLNLGVENDLFPGEKIDYVLSVLSERLKNIENRTRQYDVLKGILESNEYERLLEKKKKSGRENT